MNWHELRRLGLFLGVAMTLPTGLQADRADQARWDAKYQDENYLFGTEPVPFLKRCVELLPRGKTLDLAMGEGRNGVFLASAGFDVLGMDISEVGLRKARRLARRRGTTLKTEAVDLAGVRLPAETYDVIVVTYYLQRDLFPKIKKALKRGGVVVIETYSEQHARYRPTFPKEYLLKTNELLDQFRDFVVLRYQVVDDGEKAYASIAARKP